MDRFDNLYTQICSSHSIFEAGEDLPSPPGAGTPPGAGAAMPGQAMPTGAPQQDLPPVSPEDNIETDNEDESSALVPGKKIELIKLISLCFVTNGLFSSSAESNIRESELRDIKMFLNNPTTIGNVEKVEKALIRAIAKLQNIEPYEIAKNIGFVTPSSNKETSSKYISNTEYTQLIELARKALISDPNKTGSNDKFGITDIESINSGNAEETLTKLKSILGGEVA